MCHRRIFLTLRPQTPKEKSLGQTCSQFPFSVGGLLPVDRGKSTGASVRHVVLLAPLGRRRGLDRRLVLSLPLGGRWQPEGLTDEGNCGHGKGPANSISSPHQSASQTASPKGSLRPAEPRTRYGVRGRGHPTLLWTAPGDESKQGGRGPLGWSLRGGPGGESRNSPPGVFSGGSGGPSFPRGKDGPPAFPTSQRWKPYFFFEK